MVAKQRVKLPQESVQVQAYQKTHFERMLPLPAQSGNQKKLFFLVFKLFVRF